VLTNLTNTLARLDIDRLRDCSISRRPIEEVWVAEQLYRMLMTPSGDGSSQRLADRNGCPVFISRTNTLSLQRLEHIGNVPYQRN
jgi:hypothetical protein